MPTNHYFNNYGSINEQRLVEDIIVESIKIMGTDVYYLPNNNDEARDLLFGEDPLKKFKTAYPIEIYPSNVMEYGGEKEFFSKFGLEIKDQVSIIMSKRSFAQRVYKATFTRPREGDLIYVPFLNGTGELYEIKFTNQTKDFFMLGRKVPYFYELSLEKFRYSQEVIDVGIPDIDVVVTDNAYTIDLQLIDDTPLTTGDYQQKEIVFQSVDGTYANAYTLATVTNWDKPNLILSVVYIKGEFLEGNYLMGNTSGALYMISSYNPLNDATRTDVYDNEVIESEASPIINTDETNPFGGL